MKAKKLLVISSYPAKNNIHGKKTVGIASFAKNKLYSIKQKDKNVSITVLAEKLKDQTNYTEKEIKVKRVWRRNSFSIFPSLLREIFSQKEKYILIEFELSMFGSIPYLLPLPIFLFILKLYRKKIIFVFHQVIPDFKEISLHINLNKTSKKTIIMSSLLSLFYSIILRLSDKTIVFEKELKNKLSMFGNPKKIVVIPHGVEKFNKIPKENEAREKLKISKDSFTILLFGYLAWYKGTDWILEMFFKSNLKGKNIKLLIVGGPNPNHLGKPYYEEYISSVKKACGKNGIKLTGFVSEDEIPFYFQASDLVILPYRTFMSSSGPLSLAFSFEKPFLLSKKIKGILKTEDIKDLMGKFKIEEKNLYFNHSVQVFEKIDKIKKDQEFRKKIISLSKALKQERSWDKIGKRHYEEIFN